MVEVTGTLIVSLFGSFLEIGVYSTLTQIEVLPNPNPIPGCTYPDAANYVPYADQDNGSCMYEGCSDPWRSTTTHSSQLMTVLAYTANFLMLHVVPTSTRTEP